MSFPKSPSATIEGIPFGWDIQQGICSFGDHPAVMIWLDTTLAHLMDGMQKMVGTERYLLS